MLFHFDVFNVKLTTHNNMECLLVLWSKIHHVIEVSWLLTIHYNYHVSEVSRTINEDTVYDRIKRSDKTGAFSWISGNWWQNLGTILQHEKCIDDKNLMHLKMSGAEILKLPKWQNYYYSGPLILHHSVHHQFYKIIPIICPIYISTYDLRILTI